MIAKVIAWGSDRGRGPRPPAVARSPRPPWSSTAGRRTRASSSSCSSAPGASRGRHRHGLAGPAARCEARPSRSGTRTSRVLQAAIELADAATATERARFYALARRGRPQADAEVPRDIELRHYRRPPADRGRPGRARRRIGVVVAGQPIDIEIERLSRFERRLTVGGTSYRAVVSEQGSELLVEVDGVPHRIARDDGGVVRNRAPAVVVAIPVEVGDEVEAGDVIAVVESMKMESSLRRAVPRAGRRGRRRAERAPRRPCADAEARATRRRCRACAGGGSPRLQPAGAWPAVRGSRSLPREPAAPRAPHARVRHPCG